MRLIDNVLFGNIHNAFTLLIAQKLSIATRVGLIYHNLSLSQNIGEDEKNVLSERQDMCCKGQR